MAIWNAYQTVGTKVAKNIGKHVVRECSGYKVLQPVLAGHAAGALEGSKEPIRRT